MFMTLSSAPVEAATRYEARYVAQSAFAVPFVFLGFRDACVEVVRETGGRTAR